MRAAPASRRAGPRRTVLPVALFLALHAPYSGAQVADTKSALETHVRALADPTMQGRATTTPGAYRAERYITEAFRRAPLAPGGDGGGFVQEFDVYVATGLGDANDLRAGEEPLRLGIDWEPLPFSRPGRVEAAEVVFAGHGIVAPPDDGISARDDFSGVDVAGRWALVLQGVPGGLTDEERRHLLGFASLRDKARAAGRRGAIGILLLEGEKQVPAWVAPAPAGAAPVPATGIGGIAAISLSRDAASRLLGGDAVASLEASVSEPALRPEVPKVVLEGTIDVRYEKGKGRNVIGVLAAVAPRGGEAELPVVIGAHYDHVGHGEIGGSRPAQYRGQVHRGADDNASGVAALIELARRLAPRRGELVRDVVFAAWSGEEIGLLGSMAYAPEGGPRRFAAYLNMDMVGRLGSRGLEVHGLCTSPEWAGILDGAGDPSDPPLGRWGGLHQTTDTASFYSAHVPVLGASTRAHDEWHTPADVPELVSFDGIERILAWQERVLLHLARRATVIGFTPLSPSCQ